MGSLSRVVTAALAATAAFGACADDAGQTVTAAAGDGETAAGTGVVAVQLEPVEGVFIEGFEVGLRFERVSGEVIASTLWSDYIAQQVPDPSMEDYYGTVLRQEVPAGTVVVLASVNTGSASGPEIPDVDGDLRCRLELHVEDGAEVRVEATFDPGDDCLRTLPQPSPPSSDPPNETTTTAGSTTTASPDTTTLGEAHDYASVLVGKTFKNGDAFVRFERRDSGDVVAWQAACNTTGASVVVSESRLDVGEHLGSTAVGCEPEAAEADRALTAFMVADPEWSLIDRRLTLRSGTEVRSFDER